MSRAYTSTCTIRCRKEGALKGNQVDVIDYQDWLGCVKIFDTADPTLYQCLL